MSLFIGIGELPVKNVQRPGDGESGKGRTFGSQRKMSGVYSSMTQSCAVDR